MERLVYGHAEIIGRRHIPARIRTFSFTLAQVAIISELGAVIFFRMQSASLPGLILPSKSRQLKLLPGRSR